MIPAPPKIDILPEHLIDQIKAGEVIERPGNLIKEILENAIDAKASKLELHLINNGLDLISLKDNGHGMSLHDLPLAFSRHATSKLERFEDLYRLKTFGFRGEALASIAAISKLQCLSFIQGDSTGSEIRIEGGQTLFHGKRQASGFLHGTELMIQDLFYNTPARLKFIQSQNSEKQFIRKVLYSFLLSNPQVEFHFKLDDADKEIYRARTNLMDRLKDLFPKAQDQILRREKFYENNELELYLIPGQFRSLLKCQYVFINNRMILDKQLHRVITNALQLNFGQDDFHYLAFLSLPPDNIDVNVHPSKTTIKCLDTSKIIALVTSTIKEMSSPVKSSSPLDKSLPNQSSYSLPGLSSTPSLLQDRHEYNMEGQFSPHRLQLEVLAPSIKFFEHEFILQETAQGTYVYSGKKLLEKFFHHKLTQLAPTIPLLVSEPYSAIGVNASRLSLLSKGGLEIEMLGPETLVLRGIPEWLDGFPLKDILNLYLQGKSFSELSLNFADWSTSTWETILKDLNREELLREKICLHLGQLLQDKLK